MNHNTLLNFFKSHNIAIFGKITNSINNATLVPLSSLKDVELIIPIINSTFPNYVARNVTTTLNISIEPIITLKPVLMPFKYWSKFTSFINFETNMKSTYHKLPKQQKQTIIENFNSSPIYFSTTQTFSLKQIREIQKYISSISHSDISLTKNCLNFFKNLPNLQHSLENHIIPYQRCKSTIKGHLHNFISQTKTM